MVCLKGPAFRRLLDTASFHRNVCNDQKLRTIQTSKPCHILWSQLCVRRFHRRLHSLTQSVSLERNACDVGDSEDEMVYFDGHVSGISEASLVCSRESRVVVAQI